ncbi:hypothetical protein SAMD00019534_092090 [Acytostelium subglobosum LB1]|uniref:hypothetical protein n=1 Tax=Acytostelium subglobosum LB1 TaxID=1410327 RepID=UPI000644E111|nr:hypothetical protein SAMD00019534_092090 [Acytostelium subglobosum LB1]GAM26034.1 hypothetical protein SAMD00019534_092090 [Acytostelium subglobosum LB1]|eukprot:XP_012751077.1 hypothetical protein SAMD00019534_092090 [Acytostelium subglobosum LB1]
MATILLSGGQYKGSKNKNLKIDFDIQISVLDTTLPVINCEGVGQAFNIERGATVTFNGFSIVNCSASLGAAMSISSSTVFMEDFSISSSKSDMGAIFANNSMLYISSSSFQNNTALDDGGALFLSSSSGEIKKSLFVGNKRVFAKTTVPSNIFAFDRSIVLVDFAKMNNFTFSSTCSNSSISNQLGQSFCDSVVSSSIPSAIGNASCIKDGVCNPLNENFFSCPSDCPSTSFSGFLQTDYLCLYNRSNSNWYNCSLFQNAPQSLPTFHVMDNVDGPLLGNLTGYFNMPFDGPITLLINISNLNLNVSINRRQCITYQFDPTIRYKQLECRQYLVRDQINQLVIDYSSNSKFTNPRKVSIVYKLGDRNDFKPLDIIKFSRNVCGDNIFDKEEDCEVDKVSGFGHRDHLFMNSTSKCGDGICNEENPNQCLVDCSRYITERCPALNIEKGRLVPFSVRSDTLGKMLSNRMIWGLPGYQHMSFAINIVNGVQAGYPILQLSFCNDKESSYIEDVFRNAVYQVPKEISAVPQPRCTFSVTNKIWSSSSEMSSEMSKSTAYSIGANANGNFDSVGVQASVAFSREQSTSTASKLSFQKSGSLIDTSVICSSSSVQLTEFVFHPHFLEDLANAESDQDFDLLLIKYGTHIYHTAILGGQLKQITFTSKSTHSADEKSETTQQTSMAFSTAVTSPVLNVHGDYSSNTNSATSSDSMNSFAKSSSRSQIISKGGAPGSFGPSASSAPTTFGEWASSVDMLPVPVNYTLIPIRGILNPLWRTRNEANLTEMWTSAETRMYKYVQDNPESLSTGYSDNVYNATFFWVLGIPLSPVTIQSVYNSTIRSRVNTAAILGFDYNSLIDKIDFIDGTLVQTVFQANLDPRVFNITFLLQDRSKFNMITRRNQISNAQGNVFEIKNKIFLKSQTTIKLPGNYIWENNSISTNPIDIPIFDSYDFDKEGNLVAEDNTKGRMAYLYVPPMAMDYKYLAINIHIGGYVRVVYINNINVPQGKWRLFEVPSSVAAMILVATAIDYSPNYDWIAGRDGAVNWYTSGFSEPGVPEYPGHWFMHNDDSKKHVTDLGVPDGWPYMAVTTKYIHGDDDRRYNELGNPSWDVDVSKIKIYGTNAIFQPIPYNSYFFLGNGQSQYIVLRIGDSKQLFTGSGMNDHPLDQFSVGRLSTVDTIRHINRIDNDDWWKAVVNQLPSPSFIPPNMDDIVSSLPDADDY